MSQQSAKEDIVRELRNTDEPALSAKHLAENLDYSVRTINNHVSELVDKDRIEATQIGNATAYYIPVDEHTSHRNPEHTCTRCGRTTALHDFAKVEFDTYFDSGNIEDSTSDFDILCRFCYSDIISWVNNDTATMGEYRRVHNWLIPENQLNEVRNDPDIVTAPSLDPLDGDTRELFEIISDVAGDEGAPKPDVESRAEEAGFRPAETERLLKELLRKGYLFETLEGLTMNYIPAK